jgi:dynein heavy chain
MECVAVLLDEKTDWENVKKIMADPNFLPRMRGLNLKAIS